MMNGIRIIRLSARVYSTRSTLQLFQCRALAALLYQAVPCAVLYSVLYSVSSIFSYVLPCSVLCRCSTEALQYFSYNGSATRTRTSTV